MSSSYGPNRWPPAPAFTANLASQDVYANPLSPLTVIGSGGGPSNVAPTIAPSIPSTVTAPTASSITYNYNISSVNGTPLADYSSQYADAPTGPWFIPTTVSSVNNFVEVTLGGLTANTNYYFQTVASNVAGAVSSAVVLFSTISGGGVAPSPAPDVPTFVNGTATSNGFSINFAVATTGTPNPTFSTLYGTTLPLSNTWPAVLNMGVSNVYNSAISSLASGTPYYVASLATNAFGVISSATAVFSTIGSAGVGPNVAPSIPLVTNGSESQSGFQYTFNVSSVTGTPTPSTFSIIAASHYPSTIFNGVGDPSRSVTASGLSTGTYTVYSVASNASGVSTSVVSLISTTGAGGAPSSGGSNLTYISATSNSIFFSYDTAGITADNEQLSLEYFIGTTSPPSGERFIVPKQTLGNIVSTVATGLATGTNYYFQSYITNQFGEASSISIAQFSTLGGVAPVAPTTVSTIIGVGFISYGTGGYSNVLLDTSQNVNVGNWQTNGIITYPGAEPAPNGVQTLSTLQGTGNKLVLSLGGAAGTTTLLSTMFGNPTSYDQGARDLANSLCYAYFKGPAASNPLGYASTAWTGFSFDGIDLDIEAATPSTTTLYVFASTLKANPGFSNKIITAAPQTPYLTQPSGSGLNANGAFASFSAMNGATDLSAVYTGNAGNQFSLLSPGAGGLIDYHFIQCYNNAAYSYPTGATNANWTNVVAAWGIQALQCGHQFANPYPGCIFAFGTTDATPLWDPAGDAVAFNTSLVNANSTIRAFSTVTGVFPYTSVSIDDWCSGIGFWAANTAPGAGTTSLTAMSTMYGQPSTLNNMPTDTTMTYGGLFNSSNWGFVGGVNVPIPNARGY